jgi:hypothetical protein
MLQIAAGAALGIWLTLGKRQRVDNVWSTIRIVLIGLMCFSIVGCVGSPSEDVINTFFPVFIVILVALILLVTLKKSQYILVRNSIDRIVSIAVAAGSLIIGLLVFR